MQSTELVGFRHGKGQSHTGSVRIEFVTAGWLWQKSVDEKWVLAHAEANESSFMASVSAFVLDEVHERSKELDCLLYILRQRLLPGGDPRVVPSLAQRQQVVLMSATADKVLWREYFSSNTGPLPADAFHEIRVPADAKQHKLELCYMDGLVGSKEVCERAAGKALWAVNNREGDILVFVPGADEKRMTRDRIMASNERLKEKQVKVFTLAASHSDAARQEALGYTGRKIIVSTNVAESGITLPRVTVVVDSGLCRQTWYEVATRTHSLERCYIAQSSAEQRAGRAGRICDGEVFHLYPKEVYDQFPSQAPSAILTEDCIDMILCLALRTGNIYDSCGLPQPPSKEQLQSAMDRLLRLGIVRENGDIIRNRHIIPSELVFSLGLDFRPACMILGAIVYGCLGDMIVLVAVLAGE